jgi:hypothetical protein
MSTWLATAPLRLSARLARGRRLWPAAAWIGALFIVVELRHWSACISAAFWGLLLLSSFMAWGACLVRWLNDRRHFDAGLLGAFGMALTLAVFGVLACLRLVSVGAIVAWSATGPLLWCITAHGPPLAPMVARLRQGRNGWFRLRQPPVFALGVLLLGIVAMLGYAHSVMNASFNPWDDEMAYRSFIRQFLDTGTLLDGFSFRRVGAYGGVSLLQAMVMALADRDRVHILDNGICLLIPLGIILGYRRGPAGSARAGVLLAAFLLLTLPYFLHNLGGEYSGLMFFLALFALFDRPGFDESRPLNNVVLTGLLGAAICTLRQNYISAAFGFIAIFYLARAWFPADARRGEMLKQAVAAGAAVVAFLLPWAVLSMIAIHTPFYPVLRGNVRPDFGILGSVTFDEEVRWALQNLFMFTPVTSIALFFLAVFTIEPSHANRAIQAFMFACIGAFALMMHFFRAFHDAESIARYYFAFTVAFCLAATLRIVRQGSRRQGGTRANVAVALVAFAIGFQFLANKATILENAIRSVTDFNDLVRSRGRTVRSPLEDLYARIQAAVPPGQPILVMLDHTYLLDHKRNPILNYDHPGTTGPERGPPAFEGPEALVAYLGRVGVRYLAYQVGPSSREYDPDYWRQKMAAVVVVNGRGGFYKVQGKFELDAFTTFTRLAETRKNLFAENEIRVLDLQTRR